MRKAISRSVTLFLLFVVMVTWCSSGYAISEDNSVQPLYDLTRAYKATITISEDGTAQCFGRITATNRTDSISITLTLYRKVGNSWFFVKSWSESDRLYYASVNESHKVSSGTYKVQLNGTVVAADGTTKALTAHSYGPTGLNLMVIMLRISPLPPVLPAP